jgi:single-strand DNA-binding protein
MSKGVNKVFLLGRLGKDPEIRTTAGGMTVASFTVATSDRVKGQDGQWTDKTEWHNLVAFQRTAEIVRDYCKKGKEIFVEGKIQTRSWDDKESGQKKYRTEILVNELSLLGGGASEGGERSSSSSGGYSSARSSSSTPVSAPSNDYADQGITDEDIPF